MSAMTLVATGNISPSRFVKLGSTAGKGTQAGAGELMVGVSQRGTRRTPYSTLDDGYAAIAGENVGVFGLGARCYLEIGATTAVGNLLKSDSSGRGTPVTSNNDIYGARALQSGASGDLIEVEIVIGYYGA